MVKDDPTPFKRHARVLLRLTVSALALTVVLSAGGFLAARWVLGPEQNH
jgi:hypothetical protein